MSIMLQLMQHQADKIESQASENSQEQVAMEALDNDVEAAMASAESPSRQSRKNNRIIHQKTVNNGVLQNVIVIQRSLRNGLSITRVIQTPKDHPTELLLCPHSPKRPNPTANLASPKRSYCVLVRSIQCTAEYLTIVHSVSTILLRGSLRSSVFYRRLKRPATQNTSMKKRKRGCFSIISRRRRKRRSQRG